MAEDKTDKYISPDRVTEHMERLAERERLLTAALLKKLQDLYEIADKSDETEFKFESLNPDGSDGSYLFRIQRTGGNKTISIIGRNPGVRNMRDFPCEMQITIKEAEAEKPLYRTDLRSKYSIQMDGLIMDGELREAYDLFIKNNNLGKVYGDHNAVSTIFEISEDGKVYKLIHLPEKVADYVPAKGPEDFGRYDVYNHERGVSRSVMLLVSDLEPGDYEFMGSSVNAFTLAIAESQTSQA